MTVTDAPPRTERGSVQLEVGPELGEDGKPSPRGWRWIGMKFREELEAFTARKPGGPRKYITARQVFDKLDLIVGPGNWSSDLQVIRADHPVSVRCGIAVYDNWRWDIGYSNNPDAADEFLEYTDERTGEVKPRRNPAYEDEPLKAAASDGFKRAAVQWGIGRFLYDKDK